MHIHDIDIALWWFGQPASVHAEGWSRAGLPMTVDATWRYPGDMTAHLYSSWDPHGGAFRHAFRVVLEAGTLTYDLAATNPGLQLWQDGKAQDLPVAEANAYQAEIDDFARCAAAGLAFDRFSPSDSRRAVEYGLQEMAQLKQRR